MIPENLLGAGIVASLVVAFWTKLKAVIWRLWNLMVAQSMLQGHLETAFRSYLYRNARRTPFGEKVYQALDLFVRPASRRLMVAFETPSTDATAFFIGWRPMFVKQDHRSATPSSHGHYSGLTVTYLRGMFDMEAILKEAVKLHNDFHHGGDRRNRYQVHRVVGSGKIRRDSQPGHGNIFGRAELADSSKPTAVADGPVADTSNRYLEWTPDQLGEPLPDNPFEFLAYPPEGLAVLADAEWWFQNEAEYKSRGIPWRLGVALTGVPGTGKTSLVRAIAQKLGLPLFAIELSTMTDAELIATWRKARDNAPAVILLEDVDTTFHGREVVEGGPEGLSFGVLLNCLSGAEGADGVLVFVTTNHPETLDPALGAPDPETGRSTRPGRIDRVVELGPLDAAGRRHVAGKILAGFDDAIVRAVADGEGMTGAQFQNLATERAFELIRAKKESLTCPPNPNS